MPFWKEPLGLSDSMLKALLQCLCTLELILFREQHGLNRAADLQHTCNSVMAEREPWSFHFGPGGVIVGLVTNMSSLLQ